MMGMMATERLFILTHTHTHTLTPRPCTSDIPLVEDPNCAAKRAYFNVGVKIFLPRGSIAASKHADTEFNMICEGSPPAQSALMTSNRPVLTVNFPFKPI